MGQSYVYDMENQLRTFSARTKYELVIHRSFTFTLGVELIFVRRNVNDSWCFSAIQFIYNNNSKPEAVFCCCFTPLLTNIIQIWRNSGVASAHLKENDVKSEKTNVGLPDMNRHLWLENGLKIIQNSNILFELQLNLK